MTVSFLPQRVYDSIWQVDLNALSASGVRLILSDLDNTISPYSVAEPPETVFEWKRQIEACQMKLFVLSNNRSPTRIKQYCKTLGVPFIDHAGKPNPASFFRAMEQMGCTPKETVMLGDQIFTDVLGGNRAGIPVYLVKPIRIRDNPLRALRHGLEMPLIWTAKAAHKR